MGTALAAQQVFHVMFLVVCVCMATMNSSFIFSDPRIACLIMALVTGHAGALCVILFQAERVGLKVNNNVLKRTKVYLAGVL
jgi:hypothetical protein